MVPEVADEPVPTEPPEVVPEVVEPALPELPETPPAVPAMSEITSPSIFRIITLSGNGNFTKYTFQFSPRISLAIREILFFSCSGVYEA